MSSSELKGAAMVCMPLYRGEAYARLHFVLLCTLSRVTR